ncbi:DNA-binding NtrC family response regulator [Ochrobactrum sp. 19YEA23]|uniref:sigma-54-dependent transcriptional regulator n=1 Tax=Ochrobactrum sp. 19YEA23 TaxID=3039854 RepID=UPI0024796F3F|nr:DNA-binding NtrC family response regulator [Ochrobactrum sp. 19YEA23]
MGTRILIADDDPIHRRNIEAMVQRMGYRTILTDGGSGALSFATQRKDIALILLDMAMPDMDGLSVLAKMRDAGVTTPVIVLVQNDGLNRALQAIKLGAVDFVTTPVVPERIQLSISNVLKLDALAHEVRRNRSLRTHFPLSDIIARSPDMERAMVAARRAAALDAPLLLDGEPGSGKETLARAICSGGARWRETFITVDCRTLTSDNVDQILFGASEAARMPGSAIAGADGVFGKLASADGGTLYLDEVGFLPRHAQMRLYSAMQTGQFEAAGVPYPFNARVMASTTQPLNDLVHMGRFHPGLGQLLGSFMLPVPALRNRPEDIGILLHHFTMRFASEERRGHITGIAPHVLEQLKTYDWPGNVRELKNAVFRAVLLCETRELTMTDFAELVSNTDSWTGASYTGPRTAMPVGATSGKVTPGVISGMNAEGEVRTLAAAEEEMIRFALAHYDGQISEVARRLGIGRTTLYRKLKEYGIDVTSISGRGFDDGHDGDSTPFRRTAG